MWWRVTLGTLGAIILLAFVAFALNWFGVFGQRIIFENSFQYQEARKLEVQTYQAQLAEIDVQLRSADATTRERLLAQRAAISVRLRAAEGRLK